MSKRRGISRAEQAEQYMFKLANRDASKVEGFSLQICDDYILTKVNGVTTYLYSVVSFYLEDD